ncbi:MAG: putative patatin/cPLA2 family phospholipase [Bermanella sp.]|jgi:predicted patatin/cPLA2 family phospholipase|uniref:patatin-like phospholipase family protein n=1 Tax=Glaciecola sp. 33A TaxID=2057807 RepID=UPI000C343724|nr:patatin family protein [Glaciecola sp. 33A]PKI02025.1 patatin family protein [Glaciecola sp. 33A]
MRGRIDLSVKVALIAEGGGQRGIFTAGVLDAWLEHDFDPFDLFIGTSSGSQNLTSFLSRQKGYAKRLIRGLSRQKRFYKLGRGLMGGNVVDLDWYFDKTIQGSFALDFAAAKKSLGERELLITATNSRDRKGYFLRPNGNSNHWRKLLKASSALPFLYKEGVKLTPELTARSLNKAKGNKLKGNKAKAPPADYYLDGGLAAPLPVREAYRRGARKIVIIRTVNADFHAQSVWLKKLKSLIYSSGHCPKTIDYLLQHEQAYRQELAFIANPPDDVELIQIFAKDHLRSKRLGSSDMDLQHDYGAGIDAGNAFLRTS